MRLNNCLQLALDQCFKPHVAAQRLLERVTLLGELVLLTSDLDLFQFGQIAKLEVKDSVSLNIVDLEGFNQHRFGLIRFADNADHLVNV